MNPFPALPPLASPEKMLLDRLRFEAEIAQDRANEAWEIYREAERDYWEKSDADATA